MTQNKSTTNQLECRADKSSSVAFNDRLLRRHDVEQITALSRSSIYAMITAGTFPKPLKISVRAVRWSYVEVAAWVAGKFNTRENHSSRYE